MDNNKEHVKGLQKAYREKLKRVVLAAYGNKCICCGEANIGFLSIDHINNDGTPHRRSIFNGRKNGSATQMYAWIRKNNFPDWLQVLCFNCNFSKNIYGVCAHTLEEYLING